MPGLRLIGPILLHLRFAREHGGTRIGQLCRISFGADARRILFPAHPDKFGTVTVWSSNAYVQCRSVSREELICESAGELLQPSLSRTLTPERKERLAALVALAQRAEVVVIEGSRQVQGIGK